PFLRRAIRDSDLEVARRAEECLRVIEEKETHVGLIVAAAHLVSLRKPPGAASVLLAYAPFAEDDAVSEEIRAALLAVALEKGKPDKVLGQALTDPMPVRRALAAEILCKVAVDQRPQVAKRLHAAEP